MKRTGLAGFLSGWILLAQACGPARSSLTPTPILTVPSSSVATPTAESPPLIFLTSEPGKYQVQLPVSEGILEYSLTSRMLGRPVECHVTFSRLDYGYAAVEYCDLPADATTGLASSDVLAQTRADAMRPFRAQVASEQASLADDTFPSLALSGRLDMRGMGNDGSFDARMILADKRLYLVLMAASDGDLCGCIALKSRVVDSFHVEPDLSIPFEPSP